MPVLMGIVEIMGSGAVEQSDTSRDRAYELLCFSDTFRAKDQAVVDG